jgi:hypothetical protein
MLTLLGTLAHNVLVWAREWLSSSGAPPPSSRGKSTMAKTTGGKVAKNASKALRTSTSKTVKSAGVPSELT